MRGSAHAPSDPSQPVGRKKKLHAVSEPGVTILYSLEVNFLEETILDTSFGPLKMPRKD